MKYIIITITLITSCIGGESEKSDPTELKVLWDKQTNIVDSPDAQPLVIEDSKIIYTGEPELVAIDIENGEELWRGVIDNEKALISEKLLYDQNRKRIISNHMNDVKIWNSETGELLISLMEEDGVQAFSLGKHTLLDDGYGIVGDTVDAYVLNTDGSIRFLVDFSLVGSGLAYVNKRIIMTMAKTIHGLLTKGKIIAFDSQTGDSLWMYNTDNGGFIYASPKIEEGVLYAGTVGNSPENTFVALNAETGELIWEHTNSEILTRSFVIGPKYVYINTSGKLVALNKANGEVEWRFEWSSSAGLIRPVYLEGYVYHSDHNRLFVIDAETGELVHEEPLPKGGGYFWHVATSSDKIFAQTSNQLTAYQPWHLREE